MNKNSIANKKPQYLSKIFTILIIMMQPLNVYTTFIPNVAFGEFLMIVLLVVLLLDMIIVRRGNARINIFIIYVIYSLMVSAIIFIFIRIGNGESIKRLIRDGFYLSLFFIFGVNYFNYDYGIKLYKSIAIALSIYIILQFLLYKLFRYHLYGFFPFLSINVSNITGSELMAHVLKMAKMDGYLRPNGFLIEPAACAQYISPALIVYLFEHDNSLASNYEYKNIVLIITAMLLTVSANAYISLFFILFVWSISKLSKNKISKKLLAIIILLLITGTLFLAVSNLGKDIVNRFLSLLTNEQTQGSAPIRVLRGMAFYFAMPFGFQIFGIGFGNFIKFKFVFNINTVYETMDEYFNTNAYILISIGIIGFCIYLYSIFKLTKNKKFQSKVLVFLLLLFGLSSSIYSTPTFILTLLLIYSTPYKEKLI